MKDDMSDETFADRIARPLRRRERPDETFEARAMSAVHAVARGEHRANDAERSWWLRPRTVRISPIAALALAAGIAGVMVVGSSGRIGFSRGGESPRPGVVAASRDTVHVVRFVLVDSSARRVALVGEFNQWTKGATLLHATTTPGVWTIDLPLGPGRHEYAFVVYDSAGERWVADPVGQPVRDEFGTQSSVISIGAPATS